MSRGSLVSALQTIGIIGNKTMIKCPFLLKSDYIYGLNLILYIISFFFISFTLIVDFIERTFSNNFVKTFFAASLRKSVAFVRVYHSLIAVINPNVWILMRNLLAILTISV